MLKRTTGKESNGVDSNGVESNVDRGPAGQWPMFKVCKEGNQRVTRMVEWGLLWTRKEKTAPKRAVWSVKDVQKRGSTK